MRQQNKKTNTALIYFTLALITFIAFQQVIQNDFIGYDDPFYVTNNQHVKGGITLDSVLWAFTTTLSANWHPLTWLSHMLDCNLFGLNPAGHHLTSLLIHIANTLLLFWLLKKMTDTLRPSFFVAAAFALHPLHVESVAWIAERKDVLSAFFWMLTLTAYIRYTQHPGFGRYLLVVLAFALGLMAKPMLVTLPFVLLLLDYWPLRRFQYDNQKKSPTWPLLKEKIPLFILAAASGILTYIIQQSAGAMNLAETYPLTLRISNALISYLLYVAKLFYPTHLAVLYPYPADSLPLWQPILSLIALAGVSAAVIYAARQYPFLPVGWLWYLGTLVPVIGLVQVGNQARADRYTYLPSLGIFIIVAWGSAALAAKWRYRKLLLSIATTIALTALLVCTHLQVKYWKNEITLYKRALTVTKNNYIMLCNYGAALIDEGYYNEAMKHLNAALQINPQYYFAHYGIGKALLKQEKFDQAVDYFKKALHLKPDYYKPYFELGVISLKQGNTDQAIDYWKKTLIHKPDYPDASYNLAVAMTEQGKFDEAINYFKIALSALPDWPQAHYEMGRVFYLQGKRNLAIEQCEEALRLKPDYITARITLAHTLAEIGQTPSAVEQYYYVLYLEPKNLHALKNLAWILATTDDPYIHNPEEAVKFAEKACRITDYKQAEALDTLAVAYSAAARYPEAAQAAEKAVELAVSAGQSELAEKIQKRLELYKAQKPYRPTPPEEKIEDRKNENTTKTE